MLEDVTIHIVAPDGKEIVMGCKKCRRIFSNTKGKFLVGLQDRRMRPESRYFIGMDPPITCCGEEKIAIQSFDLESEAETEKQRVIDHLNIHQSTDGLKLIPIWLLHVGSN